MSSGLYETGIKELASANIVPQSLPAPDRTVSVDNPFCGDRIDLEIMLLSGRITALASRVRGCMLCRASANAVTSSATGSSVEEVKAARDSLTAMLKGEGSANTIPPGWESLALFEPVGPHKSRHGCVTLPFKALLEALS